MINLLFLLANAFASDVYEVCVLENQVWSDTKQLWNTELVTTFYSYQPIQFIVHDSSIEINRVKKHIESKEVIDGMPCYREHKNSFVCYDEGKDEFLWEFHYRNGRVPRDVLKVCGKNGE